MCLLSVLLCTVVIVSATKDIQNGITLSTESDCKFTAWGHDYDYSTIDIDPSPCKPQSCAGVTNSAYCLDDVSYGSANDLHVTQSSLSTTESPAFEFSYGSGELCNNGVNRKVTFTFICSNETMEFTTTDSCSITTIKHSPKACPVQEQFLAIDITCIVLLVVLAIAVKCACFGCLICLCKKRGAKKNNMAIRGTAAKRIGKRLLGKRILKTTSSTKKNAVNDNYDYQFDQQAYELVPGGFSQTTESV